MLQSIDQLSFFLIDQEPAVDAHLLFCNSIRVFQETVLPLKAEKNATKRLQLLFQVRSPTRASAKCVFHAIPDTIPP